MEYLLILLAVAIILVIQAWRSNRESDKSWKAMHDSYLRNVEGRQDFSSIGWKAYYSRALLNRLYPAMHDAGSYHTLISSFPE